MDFTINGRPVSVDCSEATPVLWMLRDHLGMTGTKFGCGAGLCGACTVHLAGAPVRACVTPCSAVAGQPLSTIEGMQDDAVGRAVQQAWIAHEVPQCGYCQSGQVMSAVALLRQNRAPNEREIDSAMGGNLCRCGTYQRIRAAVKTAAAALREGAR